MTWIEAIILGIIQGITEFFPVSSSGHLTLCQHLLGLNHLKETVAFDLVCHLGTLLAILTVFYKQLKRLLRIRWKQIAIATLPLFPLAMLLKPIKELFHNPQTLGFCFLITAAMLYFSNRFSRAVPRFHRKRKRYRDALLIGLSQAAAILPGISRSGSTISAARLMGWNQNDALTFSLLLAIPAILGGAFLEFLELMKTPQMQISSREYCLGFFFSFMVGYIALRTLAKMIIHNEIMGFVWYCMVLGIFSLIYFY